MAGLVLSLVTPEASRQEAGEASLPTNDWGPIPLSIPPLHLQFSIARWENMLETRLLSLLLHLLFPPPLPLPLLPPTALALAFRLMLTGSPSALYSPYLSAACNYHLLCVSSCLSKLKVPGTISLASHSSSTVVGTSWAL